MEHYILVPKVWGFERIYINNELYSFKRLFVDRGHQCSLHYHKLKDETFMVESGEIILELPGSEIPITDSACPIRILPGTPHRFRALEDSVLIEVATRDCPDDSYRIEPSR